MSDIKMEVATYNQLRENLLRNHPGLLEDDEALRDTLDGLSDLKDVLVTIVESAIEDESLAEAIGRTGADLKLSPAGETSTPQPHKQSSQCVRSGYAIGSLQ